MIDILNDFLQRFQKCKNFQDWTIPIDAQALPGLPSQFFEQASWAELVRQVGFV